MLVLMYPLYGQKMFWNDMSDKDKQDAFSIGKQFISSYERSDFESIEKLLSDQDIFIGKGQWLKKGVFLKELEKTGMGMKITTQMESAYTFDEFLDIHQNNDLIGRTWEVFDNHSVLVHVEGSRNGQRINCIQIIQKGRNSSWSITGVVGVLPILDDKADSKKNSFRIERITNAGIQLPVPKDFIGPEEIDNQIMFFYEGNSGRDAVYQVMIDQLSGKTYYYTFKFVEHNNQQFKMSNLTVRYIPAGIIYEYEVIDQGSVKNKGITIGIEKGNNVILIQYYAFYDVYLKMKEQIDYTIANIKL